MSLAFLKSLWRPVFCWLFIIFYFAIGVTVLALLWLGTVRFEEVSSVLAAMITFGGLVTGSYSIGRSWEKRHGQEQSEIETVAPPPGFGEGTGFG